MKKHFKMIIASVVVLVIAALPAFYFGWLGVHPVLMKSDYAQLPGWQNDDARIAMQAFQKSCTQILQQQPDKPFSHFIESGRNMDWQTICQAALSMKQGDSTTARQFFEKWFQPYRVSNHLQTKGMFTGYYLPLIHASLTQDDHYTIPIYGMPKDLVTIDLSEFNPGFKGQTIVAKLQNHLLTPYPDRGAINEGILNNVAPVLAWADSPIDVFFAEIQGSALVQTPDHKKYLLSYAGSNGRPYTPIGKVLLDKKQLTKDSVSMQSIRVWLEQHPDQIEGILDYNASFVFFTLDPLSAPTGSGRVALTPSRTLAVDRHYIPLGAPLWLDTVKPTQQADEPFRQLMIAQDSGGAIKGVVRGDVFWGAGEDAAFTAGHMQSPGQYWILLPKKNL